MFGSDSAFFFQATDEDDPEPLDFTFDGEANGEAPMERASVVELRACIDEYASSGDAEPLNTFVDEIYSKLEDAIEFCGASAKRAPERVPFFVACVKIYEAALDALDMLTDSLVIGSFDGVQRAQLGFEAAVADVDALEAAERQKVA